MIEVTNVKSYKLKIGHVPGDTGVKIWSWTYPTKKKKKKHEKVKRLFFITSTDLSEQESNN